MKGNQEKKVKPPRTSTSSTAHQRRLKAASNRRYYVRQQQRDPVFKQLENKARVYPLELQDLEAAEVVVDINFEEGDAGRIYRKLGYRGLVGWVAASFVREKLKLKKK
jgi:hypothetical protein